MDKNQFRKMGNSWVAETRLPGVWKKKGGGFLVRARVKDPMTGKRHEIRRVLMVANERDAFEWLEDQKARIGVSVGSDHTRPPRFGDFAVSLLAKKLEAKDIRSTAGRSRWKSTLDHLIGGTQRDEDSKYVPGFGEMFVDEIRPVHVDRWRQGIATLIATGDYSPNTANGWLSILRVVLKAASREFELPSVACDRVRDFDTSDHVTYTEEAPQSLSPEQVPVFLAILREDYPQHFAMTYLGLATGLRPSALRPLRRKGECSDVLWDEGRLLVRQSQTRGSRVLKTTKQRTRYSIVLPPAVIEVLRWHVDTQLENDEQSDSDLLFPSITGGFRSPSVLNKPFAEVSDAMELGYRFTQKGMRRTFNDLARAAEVQDLVTRSISGHLTEKMQRHYSTVRGEEQEAGLAKVINLMTAKAANSNQTERGDHRGEHEASGVIN